MLDGRLDTDVGQGRAWRGQVEARIVAPVQRYIATANLRDGRTRTLPSAAATPVVFVVDRDISVRKALEALVQRGGWHVETFSCAHEFLARPRVFAPSCLILDVVLPDSSGLDVQKHVAADRTEMPIIFTASEADVPTTVQAMKAGALEFFLKPLCDHVVLSAIERAIEFSRTARREQAEIGALQDRHACLTQREREVMALVAAGRLNKQVASELGISEITVKAHRGSAMRKMHADSFATLVGIAIKLGLAATPTR